MNKKIIVFISLFLLLLFPSNVLAITEDYQDVVAPITNTKVRKDKITLYLFHGAECPHCQEEIKWLEILQKKYSDTIEIQKFEVWHNDTNSEYLSQVKELFNYDKTSVPFTVIGNQYFVGYSDTIKDRMENTLSSYLEMEVDEDEYSLPIVGKVNAKEISIPLVAIILGFIDGFNPCAMWILLFLINMLFGMKNRKRMWILGITFLLTSATVYLLSMLGINFVLSISTVNWLKKGIALVALIAGIMNLKEYLKTCKMEAGCSVVDDKKRKSLMKKMRKITKNESFILALCGIILLAVSVNLIELACSLGFPVVFSEILSLNEVDGFLRILYLLLYVFFYMIDDLVVFIVSMVTLEATGITNKYNRLSHLVGGIIMILMALLMFFKPEWLMFNF